MNSSIFIKIFVFYDDITLTKINKYCNKGIAHC